MNSLHLGSFTRVKSLRCTNCKVFCTSFKWGWNTTVWCISWTEILNWSVSSLRILDAASLSALFDHLDHNTVEIRHLWSHYYVHSLRLCLYIVFAFRESLSSRLSSNSGGWPHWFLVLKSVSLTLLSWSCMVFMQSTIHYHLRNNELCNISVSLWPVILDLQSFD